MSFLQKLKNQLMPSTEHYKPQEVNESKINDMDRYKPVILPGQDVRYPSFAAVVYPNSYIVERDRLDPRFVVDYV